MYNFQGAPLDEVWGKSAASSRRPPPKRVSNAPTKVYDDIIDAYIDDFQSCNGVKASNNPAPQVRRQVNLLPDNDFYDVSPYFNEKRASKRAASAKPRCNIDVQPTSLGRSDYAEDALEYQNFFKGDNMFSQQQGAGSVSPPSAEGEEDNLTRAEDERQLTVEEEFDVLPQHMPTSAWNEHQPAFVVSPQTQYIELALYILSGIILIFILEQILHLGLYLR